MKRKSITGGTCTAISRAPWLRAIVLYGKGDCCQGGGLFLSRNRFWLNDTYFNPEKTLRVSQEVQRDESYRLHERFGSEDTGVYYPRLLRDGWKLMERFPKNKSHSVTVFEKPLPKGWTLRKLAHAQTSPPKGKGCYWDEHELFHEDSGINVAKSDWEWAELDQKTIVWAASGCLYRAAIKGRSKIGDPQLLVDFRPFVFEEIIAPY